MRPMPVTSYLGHSSRPRARRTPWRLVAGVVLVVSCPPLAHALDGRVDVWDTWQSGGAGPTAYDTSTLIEDYRASQRTYLLRGLSLYVAVPARRQHLESTFSGISSDTRSEYVGPNVALEYVDGVLRCGLTGLATRRDYWFGDGTSRRDDYTEFNAWSRVQTGRATVDLRATETGAWRAANGIHNERREHRQYGLLRVDATRHDNLQYRFQRTEQDERSEHRDIEYLTHEVQLRSDREFAGGRGRYSLQALGSRFRETQSATGSGAVLKVPPLSGSFTLDDTPQLQDPLEPAPIPEPALYDGNRDAPTSINIGDSAPVVRQYGGDYRNLIFDFGEPQPLSSLILYVDREVRFPALFAWSVYVSDDPEGQDWGQALPASEVTVSYQEMADQRQGWVVSFRSVITHRRVKLVDVKFGETEPDIYVTELEAYEPAPGGLDSRVRSTLDRYRVDGDLGFYVMRAVELRYATELTGRRYDDSDRDVYGMAHRFGVDWRPGTWLVSASHQINRTVSSSRLNTDATSQYVSITSARMRDLRLRAGWSRTDDQSYAQARTTNAWTTEATWQALPSLTIDQQISYSLRDAEAIVGQSRAWVTITDIRGMPRPNVDLHLRRADRWVSQSAGTGFTPFNDTEMDLNWAILPLVNFVSDVIYQVRDGHSWNTHHVLSWTPLPGGSMDVRLYLSDQQDTRSHYLQRGGGWSATWKARRRLRLEGGAEWTLVKQNDTRNTPTTWNARGTWTF